MLAIKLLYIMLKLKSDNYNVSINGYVFNEYSIANGLFKNKTLFIAPVYGARDRVTGKYDLALDSNWQMALYMAYNNDAKEVILAMPLATKLIGFDYFNTFADAVSDKLKITLVACEAYGLNAYDTRSTDRAEQWLKFWTTYQLYIAKADYVLFSAQSAYSPKLLHKGIYWAYAIATETYKPEFFESFSKADLAIASKLPTIVGTVNQQAKLPGSIIVNNYFNKHVFTKIATAILGAAPMLHNPGAIEVEMLFWPFRMTHTYALGDYLSLVEPYLEDCGALLFTDTNSSGVTIPSTHKPVKVHHDKANYLRILELSPIIVNYDNPDDCVHLSYYEHIVMGAQLILKPNKMILRNNFQRGTLAYYLDQNFVTSLTKTDNG